MINIEEFIPLHEAIWTQEMHGMIMGPCKQAFVKRADEGKTMIGVYNENGECIGRLEDTRLPEERSCPFSPE